MVHIFKFQVHLLPSILALLFKELIAKRKIYSDIEFMFLVENANFMTNSILVSIFKKRTSTHIQLCGYTSRGMGVKILLNM